MHVVCGEDAGGKWSTLCFFGWVVVVVANFGQGRALLESLVDSGRSSHTLLFNLTTMYELCTDRSRALKVKLSEKMAAMEERADGWEKTNADFKL